jgi:hypothetical protein
MWKVYGINLSMAEGDFGIPLPVTVTGATLTVSDTFKFTFKSRVNGVVILEKEFAPASNSFVLELTEAESALFPVGKYVYSADWYQDGVFLCNIVPMGIFKVVDKA